MSAEGPDTGGRAGKRILVGAASFADARAALAILDRLADLGIGDVGGLFVEDSGVLAAAANRLSGVVTSRGTIRGAPSRQSMRLMWQGDARAFREGLVQLATRRALRWSFDRQPGDPVAGLCGAAQRWDWLLIGHRPSGAHVGRVVGIAHAGEAGADSASRLAEGLARSLRSGLELLSDSAPEAQILARLEQVHAAAVVIDAATGPFRSAEQIRRLVAAARCPVLVLGAARLPGLVAHSTHIPLPPARG